jgi:hypothetical protein
VALDRTDVKENIANIGMVVELHSCVTVESLLTRLSIEGYSVGPKDAVFWAIFTAVTMTNNFWGITPRGSS